jgi:phosphoglucosamine mutase
VHALVTEIDAELAGQGRVLLRPSGTEPVIRVMVEATTQEIAQATAERIAAVVREELALG